MISFVSKYYIVKNFVFCTAKVDCHENILASDKLISQTWNYKKLPEHNSGKFLFE